MASLNEKYRNTIEEAQGNEMSTIIVPSENDSVRKWYAKLNTYALLATDEEGELLPVTQQNIASFVSKEINLLLVSENGLSEKEAEKIHNLMSVYEGLNYQLASLNEGATND